MAAAEVGDLAATGYHYEPQDLDSFSRKRRVGIAAGRGGIRWALDIGLGGRRRRATLDETASFCDPSHIRDVMLTSVDIAPERLVGRDNFGRAHHSSTGQTSTATY